MMEISAFGRKFSAPAVFALAAVLVFVGGGLAIASLSHNPAPKNDQHAQNSGGMISFVASGSSAIDSARLKQMAASTTPSAPTPTPSPAATPAPTPVQALVPPAPTHAPVAVAPSPVARATSTFIITMPPRSAQPAPVAQPTHPVTPPSVAIVVPAPATTPAIKAPAALQPTPVKPAPAKPTYSDIGAVHIQGYHVIAKTGAVLVDFTTGKRVAAAKGESTTFAYNTAFGVYSIATFNGQKYAVTKYSRLIQPRTYGVALGSLAKGAPVAAAPKPKVPTTPAPTPAPAKPVKPAPAPAPKPTPTPPPVVPKKAILTVVSKDRTCLPDQILGTRDYNHIRIKNTGNTYGFVSYRYTLASHPGWKSGMISLGAVKPQTTQDLVVSQPGGAYSYTVYQTNDTPKLLTSGNGSAACKLNRTF